MAAVVDSLVQESRAQRDGVVNTVDAVGRAARAEAATLTARAVTAIEGLRERAAQPQPQAAPESRESARFLPEDEWELAVPAPAAPSAASATAARRARDDEDDDDYPETWLR